MSTTFTASLLSLSKPTVLLYSIYSTNVHAKMPFILREYATARTVWNNIDFSLRHCLATGI